MSKRAVRTNKTWERRANKRRAAWNRVGQKFNVTKDDLDHAKKSEMNPYPILRNSDAHSAESVRIYIRNGGVAPIEYESVADYLVDREISRLQEIARLEQEGFDQEEIIERVGEYWW
jgi:hypothetical protein